MSEDPADPDNPEDKSREVDPGQLAVRLDELEGVLRAQAGRIHELERRLGIRSLSSLPTAPNQVDQGNAGLRRSVLSRVSLSSVTRVDWESLIGGNWFNRVGILAIILAVGFFLKYAFENQWLGPVGRVVIGVSAGLILLLTGDMIRRRGYRFYSNSLTGGGVSILYLSIFAGYDRYQLFGQVAAMGMMSLVTVVAVFLASRYDALAIAVLGLVGGFLTPVLLAGEDDHQSALFGYLTLLDLGVLGLAWFKRWRILNFLAGGATFLLSFAWWLEWYQPAKLRPTLLHLTILFIIFAFTGIVHQLVRKEPAREPELVLILVNAGLYFVAVYEMLEVWHHGWLSVTALLLAGFYLVQSYWIRRSGAVDRYLELALAGLAGVFLTIAIPLQFSLSVVTIGWAAEGLGLLWLGLLSGRRFTRAGAILILTLAIVHWFDVDLSGLSPEPGSRFLILLNWRGIPMLLTITALLIGAWLYRRAVFAITPRERRMAGGGLTLVAALLVVVWVTLDQWDYFRLLQEPYRGAEWDLAAIQSLRSQSRFFQGAWWALAGAALVVAGIRRRTIAARLPGLTLLFLAGLVSLAPGPGPYGHPALTLLNLTFGLHALLALTLSVSYREYRRAADSTPRYERAVLIRLLLTGANLSLLGGLSREVEGLLARHPGLGEGDLVGQAGQSILGACYGAFLIVAGALRSNRQVRLLGLLTLALTIIKVFFFDLAALEQIYRVASFIVLGMVLLLVSWHYQRRSNEQR